MKVFEGKLLAEGIRFGLVVSRWNSFITKRMLEGALDVLRRHGAHEDNLEVVWVPGSWELPMAAVKMLESDRYDALICIGCLIRGATPHFEYIAAEVTKGLASLAMQGKVPVTYGVITADTLEQAVERAGSKAGNKGGEAAAAAIEMVNLYRGLSCS